MVIQHNMLAWNAGRQLGINTKKNAKAVEKLSSGYKVNRAADDAAGLGISEKMRRQIRGLSQASDNTQDGISLCQVADGALNEVSDMLHRITELSVKSANGTNTKQDREYIQLEIQELLEEIDRISDTTTFNEQKIFSIGDRIQDTPQHRLQESFQVSITADTAKGGDYQLDVSENDGIKLMLEGNTGLTQEAVFDWSEIKNKADQTKTLADTDIMAGTYEFEKNGIHFSFEVSEGSNREEIIEALDGAEFTVKNTTSTSQPVRVKSCSVEATSAGAVPGADAFFTDMSSYKIAADEDGIWMTNNSGITTSKVTWAAMGVNKDAIGGSSFTYTCSDTGYKATFAIDSDASFQDALDSLNGNNTRIFKQTIRTQVSGGSGGSWSGNNMLWHSMIKGMVVEDTIDMYLSSADKQYVNASFEIIQDPNTTAKAQLTLKGYTGTVNTIILDPDTATETLLSSMGSGLIAGTEYALHFGDADGNTFEINLKTDTGCTVNNIFGTGSAVTVALEQAQMRTSSVTHKVQGIGNVQWKEGAVQARGDRNGFWIHSGAEAGVGVWLEVDAMSTEILGMDGLDVSTVEGAEDAMDSVRAALQKVSSNRSKIGAQQNRLEHTVKNLDNVVENTQDAESLIRDTDMAGVMVEYSNNSILLQAGQSILAQAQQSNQGILNLLQ